MYYKIIDKLLNVRFKRTLNVLWLCRRCGGLRPNLTNNN